MTDDRPTPPRDRDPPRGSARPWRTALRWPVGPLVLLLTLASLLYEPWERHPFSPIDHSEFLPILRRAGSLPDALAGLRAYYRGHGRSNLLAELQLALTWLVARQDPLIWDLARFTTMAAVVAVTLLVFSTLVRSRLGGTAAATFFVVSTPAAAAWTRTAGEPLALLAMLAALWLGHVPGRVQRPWLYGLSLNLLYVAVVLAKDALIVAVPPLLLFALFRLRSAGLERSDRRARARWLIGLGFAWLVLAGALLASARAAAAPQGYARLYGTATAPVEQFFVALVAIGVPVSWAPAPLSRSAAGLFLAITAAGVFVARRTDRCGGPSPIRTVTPLLLLVPAGAALYSPWPQWNPLYALPFQLGTASLFAATIAVLSQDRRGVTRLIWPAPFLLIATAGLASQRYAALARALRDVDGEITATIASVGAYDTLYVGVGERPVLRWTGPAATLQRFAAALESRRLARAPAPVDLPCDELRDRARVWTGSVVLVSYWSTCGRLRDATRVVTRAVPTWTFPVPHRAILRVGADLLILAPRGGAANGTRRPPNADRGSGTGARATPLRAGSPPSASDAGPPRGRSDLRRPAYPARGRTRRSRAARLSRPWAGPAAVRAGDRAVWQS